MELSQKILSDVTVYMKYAKYLEEVKRREGYIEIVDRNKGMHLKKFPSLSAEIEQAYKFVYDKAVLPSMRSMQFGGRPIEVNPTRIFNCSYLPIDSWQAFHEIMFILLSGAGVGFSVQKHHVAKLPSITKPNPKAFKRYLIGDSIEGWSESVKILIKSYITGGPTIRFDFSDIRPRGRRLITSGGKAPGPRPLKECLAHIESMLNEKETGDKLTTLECHDIVCYLAQAVLSGGIRRAALISLFSASDEDMMSCKAPGNIELNPQRYLSNNSVVLLRHKITKKFFEGVFKRMELSPNGEPGIYFTNDKDWGCNPCCEIALRPFQFCNLTEVNVSNVESQEDLEQRVAAAAFIGTLQASYTDFHYLRPQWKINTERDSLIGVSMTGIASNKINNLDLKKAAEVVKRVNKEVSTIIGINPAARTTCVKPAGTTSLVMGTSSGIHAWHNDYYIRRIRVGKNEAIYKYLAENLPDLVEDEVLRPSEMAVISIPQKAPQGATLRSETEMDLLERLGKISREWVREGHRDGSNTHNVSATISVDTKVFYYMDGSTNWDLICEWMWKNRDLYNGITVLPENTESYAQMPFEDISVERFNELEHSLNNLDLSLVKEEEDHTNLSGEVACAAGACEII